MPFRPHQWKIPPSLKDAGLFLWTDTILVPVILFFSLAITVLVRPSFGPSVFWSFQMGFQGGQFRLSACLMCLLFLRISQTRARRVGENSQMAGLLQPGRITMSQECTCAVFYFSLFLLWRLHWAVSVLFLAFTTSFWVLSSKDSSEAKIPCNIESVFVSQGWCRKLPHMGWLKAAETYSAIILDARTPRPWWWQGPPPLPLGVDTSLPLPDFGQWSWLPHATDAGTWPWSLLLPLRDVLPVGQCLLWHFPLSEGTGPNAWAPPAPPNSLISTGSPLQRLLFPNEATVTGTGSCDFSISGGHGSICIRSLLRQMTISEMDSFV